MDLDDIKKLIELFDKSDLNELEMEENDSKIKLKKGGAPNSETSYINTINPSPVVSNSVQTMPEPVESKTASTKKSIPEGDNYVTVESPMVGSFYRSPSEGAPPYVKEGDSVQRGQVLCIIEAMKLMNEIEAEVAGKVVSILPGNSNPVEYGEPLMVIETE